jgi:bifunctional UDP-N-acetylglucosamine pyrophosphorylase / glucosamine-1-phosphate N-acetyltransferase
MEIIPHIIIDASGDEKRMHSQWPKALHPILFRPMVRHALDLALSVPHQSISVILGPDERGVPAACRDLTGIRYVQKEGPSGDGLATLLKSFKGPVLTMGVDAILLRNVSLKRMLEKHVLESAVCTLGSTLLSRPRPHEKIIRQANGRVSEVAEGAIGSGGGEKSSHEVAARIYCFQAEGIPWNAAQPQNDLMEVIKGLLNQNKKVVSFPFKNPLEVMGIDDLYALHRAESILQERVNRALMHRGVVLQDPHTTWIDPTCKISEDVRIEGGCVLINSTIEKGVVIESHCRITDSQVGSGACLKQGSYIEGSAIGARCLIGPYAHLRPTCTLGADVRVGNFVELKETAMGSGTKATHLSYIGDAEIGKNVNVGCGFITCNADGGPKKHRTFIEDGVFIGSDCQVIAPIRLGRGSFIAAGTTVTEDVPEESLAISRGHQTTKEGYAVKYTKPRKNVPAGV